MQKRSNLWLGLFKTQIPFFSCAKETLFEGEGGGEFNSPRGVCRVPIFNLRDFFISSKPKHHQGAKRLMMILTGWLAGTLNSKL